MQGNNIASKIPLIGKLTGAAWPRAAKNLPGPGGLPFLGLGPEMVRDSLGLISRLQSSYGDIVSMPLPGMRSVLVCDPDLIRQALLKTEAGFGKSKLYQRMERIFGKGMVTSEGETWKKQRQTLNPAFLQKSVISYTNLIHDEFNRINKILRHPNEPFPLKLYMTDISFRILLRAFFPGCPESSARDLRDAFDTISEFALGLMWNIWTPPTFLPTPKNIRYRKASSLLNHFMDSEIARKSEETNSSTHDIIKLLLSVKGEDGAPAFTRKHIRDQILTILFAGHDTTANTLTFALWLLASNPDITSRLRDQIKGQCGTDPVTHTELRQLSYLDQIVQEAMRLYPTAWMINRVNQKPLAYKGYEFEPGTTFFLPQFLVHRHPEHWEKPEDFWPDHFSPDRVQKRHKAAFFPFAAGSRNCIGLHLATMELKIIIAELVRRYDLRPADESKPKLTASITMFPASEINLRMIPLQNTGASGV